MVKFIKKLWPYFFIAVLVFAFFYKVFLGLVPIPADLIVGGYFPWFDYKWGTVAGVPIKNSLLTDAVSLVYPLRFYASSLIKAHEFPLWNSHIFAGYPLIASFPAQVFYPTFIFWIIFSSPMAWTLQVISQILLAAFGMYLLASSLKLKPKPALFAAVSYAFGGFSMVWMEFNIAVPAAALLPWIIYFLNKMIVTEDSRWGVGFSIAFGLQFLAAYPPVSIFSILAIAIWTILMYPRRTTYVKIALFFILGVMISAVQLLPGVELFWVSQRRFEIAPVREVFVQLEYLVTLLAPNFFGNPTTGNFWGVTNYLNVCFYGGITTLMLGILGATLIGKEKAVKIALVLAFVVFVFVFDNPISRFIYNLGLWGGRSMTLNRAMFLGNFSFGILGAFGISLISKVKVRQVIRLLLPIALITTGLLIACFFLKSSYPNLAISFRNLFIPALLSWLVFFVLLLKLKPAVKGVLLLVILAAELFYFGWKFNSFTSPKYLFPETPITAFMEKNSSSRFVSDTVVLPPDMWMIYGLSSIAGYDSYYPEGVAKLIAVANSGDINASPQTKSGGFSNFSSVILERTSAKYFVTVKRDTKWGVAPDGKFLDPVFNDPKFVKVFEDKSVLVFENKNALPMAFFVDKILQASKNNILAKLNDKSFPARTTALSQEVSANFGNDSSAGSVEYSELSNSHIQIKTENSADSFLVVLNPFYPGWEAYIDGNRSQIHKVNYTFIGLFVSKGEHTIDFYYSPGSFKWGLILSLTALGTLAVIFLIAAKPKN